MGFCNWSMLKYNSKCEGRQLCNYFGYLKTLCFWYYSWRIGWGSNCKFAIFPLFLSFSGLQSICQLVLCGYLAIFMSAGISSVVHCGSWVAAVCALLICWGCVLWCLWSFLLEVGFLGSIFGRWWVWQDVFGRLVLHLWDELVGDVLLYSFDWVFPW